MKTFVMRFGIPRVKRMIAKQRSLLEMSGILHPRSDSPKRFEISLEMLNLFQERDGIEIRHKLPIRRLLSISLNRIASNALHSTLGAPCVKICPFSKSSDTYERLKAVTERR